MRKINLILLVPVMILMLFGSCQKEKYENVNLVMMLNAPVPTSTVDEYILSGRIISSGKIDLADCGFDVEIGGTWYRYSIGEIKKAGKVQGTFKIDGGTDMTDIVFYAIDKYGHTYSSDVNGGPSNPTNPTTPLVNPLSLSDPQHTAGSGYENFSASATNSDNLNYAVMEYGIEYYDPKTDPNAWQHSFSFFMGNNTESTVEMAYSFDSSTTPFIPATNYTYRYYVIVIRLTDGATGKFYGNESFFTSSAF